MSIHYTDDAVTLWHGDCIEVMRQLPDASVDAVVTDPPYELSFMSKHWDGTGIAYNVDLWRDVLRVLKPGGHLLSFGGTRTWHRLACAIEDAGFEVRDSIAWMYGSGFPKSLDVSKAMDKRRDEDLQPAADVARWLVGQLEARGLSRKDVTEHFGAANIAQQWTTHWVDGAVKPRVPRWEQWLELKSWLTLPDDMDGEVWRLNGRKGKPGDNFDAREVLSERTVEVKGGTWAEQVNSGRYRVGERTIQDTAPATPLAQKWQGWGTALKPAFEPVVVARKPLVGTVAANVERYGTGALNIDGCRIATDGKPAYSYPNGPKGNHDNGTRTMPRREDAVEGNPAGRWPANVILDESQAAELDRQSGVLHSQDPATRGKGRTSWTPAGVPRNAKDDPGPGYADTGGASRFFYTAKADSSERPSYIKTVMRLRSDLTEEQAGQVLAALREAGVQVD